MKCERPLYDIRLQVCIIRMNQMIHSCAVLSVAF